MFRSVRPVLLAVVFCLVAAGTVTAIYRGGYAIHPQTPALGIWSVVQMGAELAYVEAEAADPDVSTVLFMGDSTVMAYPAGHTLHEYLQSEFDARPAADGKVRVHSIAAQGMTPGNFYLALDNILAAKPDVVAITLNLGVFRSYLPPVLRRPELAGWIETERLLRALFELPLHHYGVVTDQMLLHQALVRGGLAHQWFVQKREQARVGHFRVFLEDWVAHETGWTTEAAARADRKYESMRRQTLPGNARRFNRRRADEFFGLSMRGLEEDHFTMRVLAAMLEELEAAGIAALIYVAPTNVDHLRQVGIFDAEGFDKTLASFRTVAERHGAVFADYHALLPDRAFRDAFGHLYHQGEFNGPKLLAAAMFPAVSDVLTAAREPATRGRP